MQQKRTQLEICIFLKLVCVLCCALWASHFMLTKHHGLFHSGRSTSSLCEYCSRSSEQRFPRKVDHMTGHWPARSPGLTPMWFLSMGFGERSGLHTWTTNNRRAWRCHTWCDSKCPRWIFKESCYRRDTTVLTKAYRKWRWLCGSAITNRQDGNYLMSTDCNFIIHLCLLYLHL